jgi:hypothetical protein
MPYKDPEKNKAARRKSTKKWKREHPDRARRSARNTNLKRLYGISLANYEEMLVKQGGGCAACGCTNGPHFSLAVDHSHKTGRVRSLLCNKCNGVLGFVDDDILKLLALVEYLKLWNRTESQ